MPSICLMHLIKQIQTVAEGRMLIFMASEHNGCGLWGPTVLCCVQTVFVSVTLPVVDQRTHGQLLPSSSDMNSMNYKDTKQCQWSVYMT